MTTIKQTIQFLDFLRVMYFVNHEMKAWQGYSFANLVETCEGRKSYSTQVFILIRYYFLIKLNNYQKKAVTLNHDEN